MSRASKLILTSISGIVVVLVGIVVIAAFNSSDDVLSPGQLAMANNPLVNEINIESEGLKRLTTSNSRFLHVDASNGLVLYYLPETGDIMSMALVDGTPSTVRRASIGALARKISWSASGNELFATFTDGIQYYNIESGDSNGINNRIYNPVFSKNADKISYTYFNEDVQEGNISIANPDLTSFKNLLPTRATDWDLEWINNSEISLIHNPNARDTYNSLSILNTEGKLSILITDKKDLTTLWSPNGQRVVYSFLNTRNSKYELHYLDLETRNAQYLGISTVATKCTWQANNKNVFCAIPEGDLTKENRIRSSNDAFVSINVTSANIRPELILNTTSVDVSEIVLLPLQNTLVFINEKNGSLYRLSLGSK